jgi:N-acetylmuramoyl-L-alanine amidase
MMVALNYDGYERYLLALVVWREARSEGYLGQAAVCHSVLNRINAGSWFGDSVSEVIAKPRQYSSMTDPGDKQLVLFPVRDDRSFLLSMQIVEDVLNGVAADCSHGATHYLNPSVLPSLPAWAQDPGDPSRLNASAVTAKIGAHVFMKVA